jgi:hypothetical protein
MGKQSHIGITEGACKAGARGALALEQGPLATNALDQPRELLARNSLWVANS